MSKPNYSNLISTYDTFASWLTKTNELVNDMRTSVVTTNASSTPDVTTGNGYVNGFFGSNTMYVITGLHGGTPTALANLNISSNLVISSNTFISANLLVTGTANVTVNLNSVGIVSNNITVNNNITVTNTAVLNTATAVTANVTTANIVTLGVTGVTTTANINVTNNANLVSANITTANITTLGVTGLSTFVNTTVGSGTSNVQANTTQITISNPSAVATVNATTFTGTAANATLLNNQNGAFYTNATNITTGTLPWNQAPTNTVNTTGAFTFTGIHTYNVNAIVNTATLTVGNASVNVVSNTTTLAVSNSTSSVTVNSGIIFVGNASANVTVNSSIFSGTANNSLALGGFIANTSSPSDGFVLAFNQSENRIKWVNPSGISTALTSNSVVANASLQAGSNGSTYVLTAEGNTISTNLVMRANNISLTVDSGNIRLNSNTLVSDRLLAGNTDANVTIVTSTITIQNSSSVATLTPNSFSRQANGATHLGPEGSGVNLSTLQSQITGNASTAYTNATNFASNATNITTGTLSGSVLPASVVNTSGNFAISGILTYNANLFMNTANQLLIGNNSVNAVANQTTIAIFNTTTNTSITPGTITFGGGATVNNTIYSGTANNASNFGGVTLGTLQSQITGNSGTAYSNAVSYLTVNNYTVGGNINFTGTRIGVGTSSPQTAFQVGAVTPGTAEATNKGTVQISSSGDFESQSGLEFKASAFSSGYGWKIISPDRGSGNAPLAIGYRSDSSTWREALTIRGDFGGTVGIGTNTPVRKFEVTNNQNFTLSSLTSSSTTATATTSVPHGLNSGDQVTIAGATPSAYNGTYIITRTGINTFTYTFAGGTSPATGTITAINNFQVSALFRSNASVSGGILLEESSTTGTPHLWIRNQSAWTTAKTTGSFKIDGLTTTSAYTQFAGIDAYSGTNSSTGAPTSLAFLTNDGSAFAERMRVGFGGNVSIGTTDTANYRLTVQRPAGTAAGDVRLTDGTYWLNLGSRLNVGNWNPLTQAGDAALIYSQGTADTGGITIGQWSNSRRGIRIDSVGRVGIGISSPANDLDVYSESTNTDRRIRMYNNSVGASATAGLVLATGTLNAFIVNQVVDNNGTAYYQQSAGGGINYTVYDSPQHIFRTSAGVERGRIDADGRLLYYRGFDWQGSAHEPFYIKPPNIAGTALSAVNTLQIYQTTNNQDAFMTFHSSNDFAFHFGLDATTNDLFVGGWSFGAFKYRVWHEGNDSTLAAKTQTLTNKRINPRVSSAASGDISPDISAADMYIRTALAAAATINAPTGTPVSGNRLMFRLKDNGTARGLTWTSGANGFRAVGITLPTTTVVSKTTYVGCIWNADDSRWDAIAVSTEA